MNFDIVVKLAESWKLPAFRSSGVRDRCTGSTRSSIASSSRAKGITRSRGGPLLVMASRSASSRCNRSPALILRRTPAIVRTADVRLHPARSASPMPARPVTAPVADHQADSSDAGQRTRRLANRRSRNRPRRDVDGMRCLPGKPGELRGLPGARRRHSEESRMRVGFAQPVAGRFRAQVRARA